MELLMGLFALFWFCFGSIVLFKAMHWGSQVSDRLLTASGQLLKTILKQIARGLVFLIRIGFSQLRKPQHMAIRPIIITPVELQHMRNHNLIQSDKRLPVEIEYTQTRRK